MKNLDKELANLSLESRKHCEEFAKTMINESWMQPITERLPLRFPGNIGGTNWGGITADPTNGMIYINTYDLGWASRPDVNPGRGPRFIDQNGYPCQAMLWGLLHAIHAEASDIVRKAPLGSEVKH